MPSRRVVRASAIVVSGLVGLGVVQLVRALPLVAAGPQRPSGEKKDKDEMKDKKKKGTGPRTQEKKAKKGK